MQQIVGLADDTETDTARRLESLIAERERIDGQIENVRAGRAEILPESTAIERIREIIALADDLTADFVRVRERFEHLHRDLRERILEDEISRGDVLEARFAGVDVIGTSQEDLSFNAFWRLLTDPKYGKERHEKDDRFEVADRSRWVLGFDNRAKLELFEGCAQSAAVQIEALNRRKREVLDSVWREHDRMLHS